MWDGLKPSVYFGHTRRSAHCPRDAIFVIRSVCAIRMQPNCFDRTGGPRTTAQARGECYMCARKTLARIKKKYKWYILVMMRHCLNCASDNFCVNCAVCSSLIVQTRCGDLKSFAHFERESEKACGYSLTLFVKLRFTEFLQITLTYLLKKYELYLN